MEKRIDNSSNTPFLLQTMGAANRRRPAKSKRLLGAVKPSVTLLARCRKEYLGGLVPEI